MSYYDEVPITEERPSPNGRWIYGMRVEISREGVPVCSPVLRDAATGMILLDSGPDLDATDPEWDGDKVLLRFRCYPGGQNPGYATVEIDLAARTARVGLDTPEGPDIALKRLVGAIYSAVSKDDVER